MCPPLRLVAERRCGSTTASHADRAAHLRIFRPATALISPADAPPPGRPRRFAPRLPAVDSDVGLALAWLQAQRRRVHAVAHAGRPRPVGKEMAEMAAAV